MPTYEVFIPGSREYNRQTVLIDGVNSGAQAVKVANSRYPGANARSPHLVDNYDQSQRELSNRRDQERRDRVNAQHDRMHQLESNSSNQYDAHHSSTSYSNESEIYDSESYDSDDSGSSGGGLLLVMIVVGIMVAFNSVGSNDAPKSVPANDTIKSTYVAPVKTIDPNCIIWANANPTLAAKLQPGDTCYGA